MTDNSTHVFERANLGKYPFTCTGISKEVFRATPDSPAQCGTSCDYCGTGIMYAYHVRGADGRTFKVGSDCIMRSGDAGLMRRVRDEQRKLDQDKRATKREARTQARVAGWKAEADARRPDFEARYGELLKRAEPFAERNEFVRDVCRKAREQARLTDGQVAALTNAIERMTADEAAKVASGHVGKVGERIERKVTVARIASFDRQSFGGGGMETVWIVTMRDESGNSIVSKTPRFKPEQGETFTLRATVKEHSEYRGEKQTLVQRCEAR